MIAAKEWLLAVAIAAATSPPGSCPRLERYRLQNFHFEGDDVAFLFERLLDGTGWNVEAGDDVFERVRMHGVNGSVQSIIDRLSEQLGAVGFTVLRKDDQCVYFVGRRSAPVRTRAVEDVWVHPQQTAATPPQAWTPPAPAPSPPPQPAKGPAASPPTIQGSAHAAPGTSGFVPVPHAENVGDNQAGVGRDAPSAFETTVWTKERKLFHADTGLKLSEQLRKWVESEGWRLVWEYPEDYVIEFPFSVRVEVDDNGGAIEGIAREVLRIYQRHGGLVGAQAIVANGNQTLVIR